LLTARADTKPPNRRNTQSDAHDGGRLAGVSTRSGPIAREILRAFVASWLRGRPQPLLCDLGGLRGFRRGHTV